MVLSTGRPVADMYSGFRGNHGHRRDPVSSVRVGTLSGGPPAYPAHVRSSFSFALVGGVLILMGHFGCYEPTGRGDTCYLASPGVIAFRGATSLGEPLRVSVLAIWPAVRKADAPFCFLRSVATLERGGGEVVRLEGTTEIIEGVGLSLGGAGFKLEAREWA
jgi:hypothetical protein